MKSLSLLLILTIFSSSIAAVHAQQPQLASYRETAGVLVDQKLQNQTTAFVTLTSTSPVEMRIPPELAEKIRNTANVTSVVITNADNCVLGVQDQACVLVNMVQPSLLESYNITEIQSNAHKVGDTLIGDINKAFALNAQFNSVYINPKGELNTALGTSGVVSGNRTISVVYTMSRPDSSYLYDGLTSILIPKQIRDDGGFYDVAKTMTQNANSTVTFAITPGKDASIYQLQAGRQFPIKTTIDNIKPLELFGVSKIDRSSYFNVGFFPLNSIVEVVVLSNHDISVTGHGGNLAPTTIKNGQKFPADLTKSGWIFDPESGQKISAIYLFGTTTSATNDDLSLTVGSSMGQPNQNTGEINSGKTTLDYSIYALIGIVVAGGAAVYLFVRR
ncbi:MAG: hypothetical protein E6K98_01205 [Thaumarchaeota archaeon]|nr:MAG: hypothetical protein E6K98_01205 [Nitrososphaerota archaeon]